MKYYHYILKRKIENIFILPFIILGRIIAFFNPLKDEYDVFFFFPFYHTGGAEKVHALITQAISNKKCIVYFTRKSVDTTFFKEFEKSGCTIKNISSFTDNKWLYFFNLMYRGIVASYSNKQHKRAIVFNGQCNFGYKISPWINNNIKQIELIHSFNTFSWIRIPFIEFITTTVMISKVRIDNHLYQYKELNIPDKFAAKIQYICNGISLPAEPIVKDYSTTLNVLYVGRGTPEKRVHLVAAIAQKVKQENSEINFTIAGDVENAIPQELLPNCNLLGNIHDEKQLAAIYKQAHILLITSNTEGFPLVVMEAMAYGCAIFATPVGDLPIHIQHKNGYITSTIDEQIVVNDMTQQLLSLQTNRQVLEQMGKNNQLYATEHFDIQLFNQLYNNLFGQT